MEALVSALNIFLGGNFFDLKTSTWYNYIEQFVKDKFTVVRVGPK